MNKTIHEVTQGSREWLALRATCFTASEAAAMMGTSPYMTRTELLRLKATGIAPEVDAMAQRRFDAGHEAEAVARPLAEAYLQEDLYPVTLSIELDGLKLLASMDGLTMDESTGFECKLWSQKIEAMMADGAEISDSHWPQLEQQLLVSGAERILFVGADNEAIRGKVWYESRPERRAAIIAGWKQFAEDLRNYQHFEVIPAAVAAPIADLPALNIQISGSVVASNLAQWKDVVVARIGEINTDLKSDTDFATAESTVKFLDDGEKKIELVKAQAQAQASDIDTLFRAMDEIKAMMRSKRLELDKLVKARKEAIRHEILLDAQLAFAQHAAELNDDLGIAVISPTIKDVLADAMKGKKSIASLRDAAQTELAKQKSAANELSLMVTKNKKIMAEHGHLFPDFAQVCTKAPEDFANLVANRVQQEKEREAQRKAEEERKAAAEARAANEQIPPASLVKASTKEGTGETPALGQRETLPADNGARIKLGDINAAIAPLSITASGLAQLGFEAVGRDRAATLYKASDLSLMLDAIIRHLQTANMRKAA